MSRLFWGCITVIATVFVVYAMILMFALGNDWTYSEF